MNTRNGIIVGAALALASASCGGRAVEVDTSHPGAGECSPEAGVEAGTRVPEASGGEDSGEEAATTPEAGVPEASPKDAAPEAEAGCATMCVLYAGQTGDGGFDPDAGWGVSVRNVCCVPGEACVACLVLTSACDYHGVCAAE